MYCLQLQQTYFMWRQAQKWESNTLLTAEHEDIKNLDPYGIVKLLSQSCTIYLQIFCEINQKYSYGLNLVFCYSQSKSFPDIHWPTFKNQEISLNKLHHECFLKQKTFLTLSLLSLCHNWQPLMIKFIHSLQLTTGPIWPASLISVICLMPWPHLKA